MLRVTWFRVPATCIRVCAPYTCASLPPLFLRSISVCDGRDVVVIQLLHVAATAARRSMPRAHTTQVIPNPPCLPCAMMVRWHWCHRPLAISVFSPPIHLPDRAQERAPKRRYLKRDHRPRIGNQKHTNAATNECACYHSLHQIIAVSPLAKLLVFFLQIMDPAAALP